MSLSFLRLDTMVLVPPRLNLAPICIEKEGRKEGSQGGREGRGKDIYLSWWAGPWISRNPSCPSVTLELGPWAASLRVLTQVLERSMCYMCVQLLSCV